MSNSRIKKIIREGDLFVMTVELQGKHRENWTYIREDMSGTVSYSLIGREDA